MSWFTIWDAQSLDAMFHPGIPVAEKIIRPIVVYMFLMGLLRMFGKREMAQLNPYDFIILVMLSNTVQNAIIGADDSVSGGLIGVFSLCAFHAVIVRVMFRHRRLEQILQGKPAVLVHEGIVDKRALRRTLITMPELLSVIRRQGFDHLGEVRRVTLEPGGTMSVVPNVPSDEERRQAELLQRLDDLRAQVEDLGRRLDSTSPSH
ncbi:MAG: DUF421 domain-containing protein [Isosphaeraceae bacterium]